MGVKIRNSEVRIERNNRMSSISTKLKEFVDLCLENDRNCIAKIIDGKEVLFVENDEDKYDIALHIKGIGEKILSFNKSIWITKSQKRFIENKKCKVVYNFYGDWILSDVKQILVSKAKDENDNEGYQAVINFDSFDFSKKKNTKEKFVHLHNHFEYSQLDGTLSAKQWISHCVKNGIDSIALTDHGTLSGSLDFYLEAKKKNIKPILGLEAYITKDLENDRKETRHLTLLARNNIGWRNLLKLNTFAQVKGFYYKPRITYKELMKRGNGLIILTGCPSSLFSKYLFEAKLKKAIELYEYYCECVGEENVYLEYQYHNFKNNLNIKAQEQYHTNFYLVLKTLKSIRKPKVVVTNDCHYILPDDFSVWEAISKISNVKSDEDSSQVLDDLYLKTRKQIIKEFQQTKLFKKSLVTLDEFIQWCDNTIEIANKCNVEIPIGQHNLPEFPFDENKFKDKEELFDKIIKDGFDLKVVRQWNPKIRHSAKHTVKDYKKRLQMEVDVIKKAGFIDYFLIIWDIIKSAKDNGIFVGAARGSVAGSLCAYVMDITDIDPLKFDLLFERFLNETRVSGERAKEADALPDIDMDFESKGRDWVKHYVENKYGNMNVCSLATYGRLQLRAAIKDIGKTYGGLSFDYLNSITGRVHGQEKEDLVEAIVKNKEVEQFVDDNPDVMKIVYRCMGQVRHSSIHPAGMIISPKHRKTSKGKIVDASLDDFIPVKVIKTKDTKEDVLVSEWEGGFVERRGLLKIDVLGIKQLDIFKNILSMIKDKIDLNFIDLEDDKVFEKFRRGDTEGVFQFKSRIQKDYQKKLQPDTFEHLIASNALLRPGAMSSDAHNDFVAFKNGDKVPHYDEGLEKVTEKTQGLYVYQEQIMQAMVVGGGLSLAEADVVRTAIKKFDKEKMGKFKDKFIKGIKKIHKYNDKDAKEVWDKLMAFSGYGFNKSHSCSYALIGYQCQWLKTYYPKEFWVVNLELSNEDDRVDYVNRIMNDYQDIQITFPDINYSNDKMKLFDNEIVWGLRHIKGVGDKGAEAIYQERKKNGKYKSLEDFVNRVQKRIVNKRVVLALIYAGAFDNMFGLNEGDDSKRFAIKTEYFKIKKEKEVLQYEGDVFYKTEYKRLLGINIIDWETLIKHNKLDSENDYISIYENWELVDEKSKCLVAGIVTKITERQTKKGSKFGIVELQQQGVSLDVLIWGDYWEDENYKDKIKIGRYIAIRGYKTFDSYRSNYNLQTKSGVTKLWRLKTKKM